MRLTDRGVNSLAIETGRRTFFDDTLPGFGIRVTPSSKTWVLVIHRHNRNEWETIGKYPVVTLAAARKAAADRLAAIQLGQDQTTPDLSFAEAFALFKQTHTVNKRDSTRTEIERLIDRHFIPKLGRRPLTNITTQDLTQIIDKLLPTPGTCWHAFATARLLFGWAAKRRLIPRSPLEGVPQPAKSTPRERVLNSDELVIIWAACDKLPSHFGALVQLLILGGQRKSQIARLHAEWIDYEKRTISFPSQEMKGSKPHVIPYGDLTASILDTLPKKGLLFPARGRNTPFNGFSKSKAALDRVLGNTVSPFVLHDCRRALASAWQALGIPIEHTEIMLAHRSGTFSGIVSVYQRHDYAQELRIATERWEQHLASLLNA